MKKDHDSVSEATIASIENLIKKNVVSEEQKKFMLWLLDNNNPYQSDYLQISGINKMVELAHFMLSNFFKDTHSTQLNKYIGALNAYFVFEVISDNLAIGLADPKGFDKTWMTRRQVLLGFNKVMQQQLNGNHSELNCSLSAMKNLIAKISIYEPCLSPAKMKFFVEKYQTLQPNYNKEELEHSIYYFLLLNIASCLNLIDVMKDGVLLPHFIKSLSERYEAVNRLLLQKKPRSLTGLAKDGCKTILVKPTLLYLIEMINRFENNFITNELLASSLLSDILDTAALLIRLQNDIGTQLLTEKENEILGIFSQVFQSKDGENKISHESMPEYLLKKVRSHQYSHYFYRIHKDLLHGEMNVCLLNLPYLSSTKEMQEQFLTNILYFRKLYSRKKAEFLKRLSELQELTHHNSMSQLILAMVEFHETLYKNDYLDHQGEYAID